MEELESFEAAEWIYITGRGPAAVFRGGHENPRSLRGKRVLIDGQEYLVLGVECQAVFDEQTAGQPFGLLVRDESRGVQT